MLNLLTPAVHAPPPRSRISLQAYSEWLAEGFNFLYGLPPPRSASLRPTANARAEASTPPHARTHHARHVHDFGPCMGEGLGKAYW